MIAWLKELFATPVAIVDAATIGTDRGPSTTLVKQLALVIDLNVCVGCHACVTSWEPNARDWARLRCVRASPM